MSCRLFVTLVLLSSAALVASSPAPAQEAVAEFVIPATDEGLPGAGPIRRYEWFRNLWAKRRGEFASRAAQERGGVVFLGDSITQGWGDDFRNDFGELVVANRGISGDTTRGMLIRLDEDVLSLEPSAVVMLMGTNDLEEGATPETIAENMKEIIGRLKAQSESIPIVVCRVFPSSATKSRPAKKIQKLNELIAAAVKGDDQITLVDTWTLFADEDGDAKKAEFPDLLHPNRAGYVKWRNAIWPVLATNGFVDKEVVHSELEPGFESLFNGKDLSGWGFRPTTEKMKRGRARWLGRDPENAPAWPLVEQAVAFDGKTETPDGRYVATNGRLVVTTPPEGRKIQQLWTTREFEGDFELRLEFRATPNADSGVFLFEPQLQCRDYSLAGPYKNLKNYRAGDWNELVVKAKDGVAHCSCNGEVIEEAFKVPGKGPIGLEGDRGQVEYRRIRFKQL